MNRAPTDVHDAANRAEALIEIGRDADAVRVLKAALAHEPENPWLLDLLVQAQLAAAPTEAPSTALMLIRSDPQSHRGHVLASFAYDQLGRVTQAVEHARVALSIAPDSLDCLTAVAHSVSRTRRGGREARRAARRATELYPNHARAYNAAAAVALHRGTFWRARRFARRALALDPQDRDAQSILAVAREAGGNLPGAFTSVGTLLELDPLDDTSRHVLDEAWYTTLVHLMWVLIIALGIVLDLRGI